MFIFYNLPLVVCWHHKRHSFFKLTEVHSSGLKTGAPCQTLKSMTATICSYIAQLGDNSLVLQMIEKVIIDQIVSWTNSVLSFAWGFFLCLSIYIPCYCSGDFCWLISDFLKHEFSSLYFVPQPLKPSLDNSCSLLRMLVTVDSKPTRLSGKSIITLGHQLPEYLMDVVQVSLLSKILWQANITYFKLCHHLPIFYVPLYLWVSLIMFFFKTILFLCHILFWKPMCLLRLWNIMIDWYDMLLYKIKIDNF